MSAGNSRQRSGEQRASDGRVASGSVAEAGFRGGVEDRAEADRPAFDDRHAGFARIAVPAGQDTNGSGPGSAASGAASPATGNDRPSVGATTQAPRADASAATSGDRIGSAIQPMAASHQAAAAGEGERVQPPVYAALDLGTNNCRLLVAVPTRPGQFRVVDAFSRIVRLGEGLGRTGRLAGPAMDRAAAALAICAQKLSARTVAGARLIATEACRAAANGEEFIERVKRETGLELEIVSRETEARLAVSGCGSLVDRTAEGAVLFDIGGGSTEIALLDLRGGSSRRLSNHIVAWTSLPVGVVSLAESHGGRDVGPELFEAMIEEVVERIARFPGRGRLDELVGGPAFHLLGTSGTVTTLAGVHLGLERYDRRQVDGLWLSDAEVTELVARIAGWSFEERVANPCIGSDRADLVLAGCAILEAIRRVWPARTLRVADRGLREGLLTEMMVADGVWRRPQPVRPKALA
ncbi:Ppx/GppA phosphatase family protein [Aureimonas sp. Leaf427]|uniref:Ppx/GppA phosphatase family protein n=1 Tax=Aureimonas sp. Leaf427 TaxID=1736375 RepID=UPI0039B75DDC